MASALTKTAPVVSGIDVPATREAVITRARAFAAELEKDAAKRDNADGFPREEIHAYGQTGLLAVSIPVEHGGPGLGFGAVADVFRIVSAADGSIGHIPQVHFGTVETLKGFGSDEQVAEVYRRILDGEVFGNAQSEPGPRANTEGRIKPTTRLLRDGKGYRLEGHKQYTTGAYTGDWIRISATDDEGVRLFVIIPRDRQGVEFSGVWNLFGQRGTASMDITFNDVLVAEHEVFRQRLDKPRYRPLGITYQLSHYAIDAGIGRGALEAGKAAVLGRKRGTPDGARAGWNTTAEEPLVITRFGTLAAKQRGVELLLEEAAGLLDIAARTLNDGDIARAAAAVHSGKGLAAEVTLEIANEVIGYAGASSAKREIALDRFWRNARVHTLHDASWWKFFHAGNAGNYFLNGIEPPVLDV
jgi:alkylation response protein AidB-like acyl-CoA dehydrogenase